MEDTPEAARRKRKQRAVLSCNDCRRRKLKCDRELPCNRCKQGGIADKCAYGNIGSSGDGDGSQRARKPSHRPTDLNIRASVNPVEQGVNSVNTSSEHTAADRVTELEQRIAFLEAQIPSLNKHDEHPASDSGSERSSGENSRVAAVSFKGRDYRTFYYGPTCPMAIISHFADLRPFMKRIFVGSTLQRLKQDAQIQEDRAKVAKKTNNHILSVPSLRSLLPDRATVEKVVGTYFATFETTYRILHVPTFLSSYQTYWDAPSPPNSDFDAIVLAIMACTLCVSTHEATQYDAAGSTFRSQAIIWLKACEAWLKQQSNKHRTLATLQVRCLRLLALSTTCYKTKEYYQEAQNHMTLMKSYGMHRDPSILGARCSVFEGEMRRRLWATSMELELQASIDKGTPSMLSGLEYDCAPPRNIMDFELFADMKELPPSQPTSILSDTSFLHCSSQSISLRVRLCAIANSLRSSATFQDILQDEQSVRDALSRIPKWNESHALLPWSLLDLQLRQFLVILHADRAMNGQLRANPDHRYSMLNLLEASATLLERHADLIDMNSFALCCTRSDYLRAGLLICHVAYHASLASDMLVTRVAKSLFDESMEKAFRLLEQRSLRPGRGNHQYWYLSAACSLVGIQFEPGRTQALEKLATDRVCKLAYKVLSLQVEDREEDLVQEVMLGNGTLSAPNIIQKTPAIAETAPFQVAVPPIEQQPFPPLDIMNENANSGWMMDDFWFMDELPANELQ